MPGLNPDPADTLDVQSILHRLFREELPAAAAKVAQTVLEAQSAPMYETRTFELTAGYPVPLLGFDRARVRALLRAATTDVYIGSLTQLSGGLGYPLPTAAGDEIKSVGEIYVAYLPESNTGTSRVFAWTERRV